MRKTVLGAALALTMTGPALAGGFDSAPVAPTPPPPEVQVEAAPEANYLPLVIFLLFAGLGVGAG